MTANYIVINSKFKPFSYAEMLQPVQMATMAHQDIENQYAELATKANVWEEMANEQTDPYAYKMYKTYSNDLEEQAGQLAREGLTPASRQNMLKMRQRYSSDIVPIEQAYKRRQELIDEQRKLLAQDNTLMFDRSASMLSLDDLIKNPQLTYQSYSGATLAKQVGTAAQNLAKEMKENPRKWRSILGNQYYETLMQKGLSSDIISKFLTNADAIIYNHANPEEFGIPSEISNKLQELLEAPLASSGIRNWKNNMSKADWEAITAKVNNYARQGLWNAVGETQYHIQSNKAYDYAMQNQLARNKEARARAAKETEDKSRLYYRAVPKTTVDGDKNTRQMNEDLKLIQEIMSNPALLNKKGTRTVRNPKYISPDPMMSFVMGSGLGESRQETYYPYQEKLKELSKRYGNVNYTITDGKLSGGNLAELAQQLNRDIRSSAVRSFSYKPNITQSDLITQVLKENTRSYYRRSNNTGLYELEDNKKGDAIDIADLNSYFTSDSDIDFDPDLGFIINSTDKDGKTRSAVLDTELLDDPNRTFSKAQSSIKAALDNGEDELATLLIEATMKAFYDRYNTLEKRQSNTFSKEE